MLLNARTQLRNVSVKAGQKGVPSVPKAVSYKQPGLKTEQASLVATAGALLAAAPALAEEGAPAAPPAAAPAAAPAADSAFDTAVDSLVSAVQASGTVIKNVDDAIISAYNVLRQGYEVASPVVNDAVKTATPVVQQAWNATSSTAGPALKSLLPSFQGVEKALEAQIPSGTTKSASDAINSASPFFNKFVQFITSNEPLTIAEYGLALVAFFYLAPALLGAFRGYSADLPSAAALNSLVNENDVVLVDIRSAKEKEAAGVPDLPSSASGKVIEVEFATTEDKKLRGQLRNVAGVESQITALEIASLKKVNKATKVLILDKNGSNARAVAKELGRKGFGSIYVIDGGFDGRGGWVQSKLQIKPAASFSSLPSIGATRKIGSGSTRPTTPRSRQQLPAPKSQ